MNGTDLISPHALNPENLDRTDYAKIPIVICPHGRFNKSKWFIKQYL